MKKMLLALVVILLPLALLPPARAETATLGTKFGDLDFLGATKIILSAEGTYFTGYLDDAIKVIKYNQGKTDVLKTYETNYAPDAVYDEATDRDGNHYVACFAHDGKDNDMGTIKFNPQGEIEWVRIFDSGGRDISWSIGVDDHGNVYTAGFTNLGKDDGVRIIKYDPQGQMVWMVIYDEEGFDKPHRHGISFDDEGNVRVKCFSKGKGIHTLTYDPNGNRI